MVSTSIRSDVSILGLHVTGDQTAAAVFREGQLVAAVAEERLNRQEKRSEESDAMSQSRQIELAGRCRLYRRSMESDGPHQAHQHVRVY